jgi:hypothetical protein
MAQLIRITSEALQATIRRLLPSQQGFGEDLQASNVITPIIDVTPTAEGSILRQDLQSAIDNTMTEVSTTNTTNTVISATGFIVVYATGNNTSTTQTHSYTLRINDGFSSPIVLRRQVSLNTAFNDEPRIFYVPSGSTLEVSTPSADINVRTNARQLADVNGNLNNPAGFTFE